MFDMFAISILVGIIFLWMPGCLLLKAIRVDTLSAASLSPIASLTLYWILTETYRVVGIFSSWISIFLPLAIINATACVASFLIGRRRKDSSCLLRISGRNIEGRHGFCLFAAYLLVGVCITSIVFIGNIGAATDFLAEFDSVHHLGSTYAFNETGMWSSFAASADIGLDESIRPSSVGGFYPSLWHTFAALLMSCLDIPVTLAANAVNFIMTAVVFPASMFFLMRILFRNECIPVLTGAFVIFAFMAFPWKFLIWGPLFPNLMSMVLTPAVCGLFLLLFEPSNTRSNFIVIIVLFLIGMLVLVFSQTNAVFIMGVFLISYLIWQASRIPLIKNNNQSTILKRVLYGIAAALVIGIIWVVFYKMPFLRAIVSHGWPAFTDIPGALFNVLTLSFRETMPQYFLGVLVFVGILGTILSAKKRKYFWITCSYLIMVVIYIICVTSEGTIKQLAGGFWYTDPMRLGAIAALFAMPLVCIGLSWINDALNFLVCGTTSEHVTQHGAHEHPHDTHNATARKRLSSGVQIGVTTIILCFVFFPLGSLLHLNGYTPAFAYLTNQFKGVYAPVETSETGDRIDTAPRLYSLDEQRFVEEAKNIVGDALVLNQPNDGSGFAFSVSDFDNLYYRSMGGYGFDGNNANSDIIREQLDDIATNSSVQDAVKNLGAEYVLKLDQGDQYVRANPYLWSYREEDWTGIDSIDDDTPGFEIVLSEGDMRLYRIVD